MTLLNYPFVVNRGWYWFQLVFFLGLPAIDIIYFAYGVKAITLALHKKVSYVALIVIFLVGGYYEHQASNRAYFVNDEYEFEINTYTIPTFLDWQVEGEIEIEIKETGEDIEFDFWFEQGPYFNLCKDNKSDSILYLMGTDYNSGHNWIINLNNQEIRNKK